MRTEMGKASPGVNADKPMATDVRKMALQNLHSLILIFAFTGGTSQFNWHGHDRLDAAIQGGGFSGPRPSDANRHH